MFKKKVYTYIEFDGHWPVGTAAIIVAKDVEEAKELLDSSLKDIDLQQELDIDEFKEVSLKESSCEILHDGSY